jgi:hypothetical protein
MRYQSGTGSTNIVAQNVSGSDAYRQQLRGRVWGFLHEIGVATLALLAPHCMSLPARTGAWAKIHSAPHWSHSLTTADALRRHAQEIRRAVIRTRSSSTAPGASCLHLHCPWLNHHRCWNISCSSQPWSSSNLRSKHHPQHHLPHKTNRIHPQHRHVHGNGKTGFYWSTALLIIPYINLAVIILNHLFFKKTGIFKYF